MEPQMSDESKEIKTSAAAGTAVGAATGMSVGGMGLGVGGTAIGIGVAHVAACGAVLGTAAYGTIKAVQDRDPEAIVFGGGGALCGAGVSATVGGLGLLVGGTGLSIGAAPVVAAGACVGMAAYGLRRTLRRMKTVTQDE